MIIVTGGAGFIGSNIIKALNATGRKDIIIVDQLDNNGNWKNLCGLDFKDFIDAQSFYQIFTKFIEKENVSAIIHMGANSDTMEQNVPALMMNNYNTSKLIISTIYRTGIRLIYASSAATYGAGPFNDDEKELINLKPLNAYAMSKHLFDLWVYRKEWFRNVVGLKYFNVFGPGEEHKGHMTSWIGQALQNRPLLFDGTDTASRDFIYIKDAVDVTLWILNNTNISGIYNVGTGVSTTFGSICDLLMEKPDYISMPSIITGKYQYNTCADITKLINAGYNKPFTPLPDAIKEYKDYAKGL